ncbi:unnamed protein product, partial [marine sediment metagenome]
GFHVTDLRGKKIPCDFVIIDEVGNSVLIEVKTTQNEKFGIPDLSDKQIIRGEMGEAVTLFADELWIVCDISKKPIIHVITKAKFEQMLSEHPEAVWTIRKWRTNDNIMEEYVDEKW